MTVIHHIPSDQQLQELDGFRRFHLKSAIRCGYARRDWGPFVTEALPTQTKPTPRDVLIMCGTGSLNRHSMYDDGVLRSGIVVIAHLSMIGLSPVA